MKNHLDANTCNCTKESNCIGIRKNSYNKENEKVFFCKPCGSIYLNSKEIKV